MVVNFRRKRLEVELSPQFDLPVSLRESRFAVCLRVGIGLRQRAVGILESQLDVPVTALNIERLVRVIQEVERFEADLDSLALSHLRSEERHVGKEGRS